MATAVGVKVGKGVRVNVGNWLRMTTGLDEAPNKELQARVAIARIIVTNT